MADTDVRLAPVLDRWSQLPWKDGLQLETLLPLDVIEVHTKNSRYEMTVTNPATGEVLVRGGRFFPEFTRAHVAGCSLGGSCLKVRGVYVGFFLEVLHEGQTILTTRVRSVDRTPTTRVH